MDKPWDVLRVAPPKPPICEGLWETSKGCAAVEVVNLWADSVVLKIQGQVFRVPDLQQLEEFVSELRQQLEGK